MTEKQRIQNLQAAVNLIREASKLIDSTVPDSRWGENGAESHYRDRLLEILDGDEDGESLKKHIGVLRHRMLNPKRSMAAA